MTPAHRSMARAAARRDCAGRVRRRLIGRSSALSAFVAVAILGACTDTNVPFYNEPTGISSSQSGIQNAVTGLFAAARFAGNDVTFWEPQFGRDIGNIQFDNPQNIQFGTGLTPIPNSDGGPWDNEYRGVGTALSLIAAIPNAAPAYTSQQAEAIVGIAETMEAFELMVVAEAHDTLGIPIHSATNGAPGPVFCNPDVWKQIVALLDTANDSLNLAGSIALPVKLPAGFGAVSATAGPSTKAGSFASFNRALAGKAGLELAYAIARNGPAASRPNPTSPGLPDIPSLKSADSAITASALYNPAGLTPPAPGGFTAGPDGAYFDFSAISGDQVNPVFSQLGVWVTLRYLVADVDTANDARWKAKFIPQPANFPLQITKDAFMAWGDLYDYYSSDGTPMPIIRNEGLVLDRAQVQLGLGNLPEAITLINDVHTGAGGFGSGLIIAANYTAVRDTLLKEERISTVFELSSDRVISLRMYGLQAVADTTWTSKAAPAGGTDLHTTILPVPVTEIEGRGGTYTLTCP